MKKTKKEQFKKLKYLADNHLKVLGGNNSGRGKVKTKNIEFKGYWELYLTIDSLMSVCILACQCEEFDSKKTNPKLAIQRCLELVKDLLPIEEGEFLDEAYRCFTDQE